MKKTNRILSILTVIALIAAMSTGMCFAAEQNVSGSGEVGTVPDVPVKLTTEAVAVDFMISESVNLTSTTGTVDLTVTPLKITNNATVGQLKLSKLEAAGQNSWTIVENGTDFANLATNTKQFSLKAETVGGATHVHDFNTPAFNIDADNLVAPQGDLSVTFSGKIGTHTTAYDGSAQVAKITPTIEIYAA